MKKIFSQSLLLIILIILCGCSKPISFEFDSLNNEVIYADIVALTKDYDYIHINRVPDDQLKELKYDLSKLEFSKGWGPPNRDSDISLRLNYKDGYTIISEGWIYWYNNENDFISGEMISAPNEFNDLIAKYSVVNIEEQSIYIVEIYKDQDTDFEILYKQKLNYQKSIDLENDLDEFYKTINNGEPISPSGYAIKFNEKKAFRLITNTCIMSFSFGSRKFNYYIIYSSSQEELDKVINKYLYIDNI